MRLFYSLVVKNCRFVPTLFKVCYFDYLQILKVYAITSLDKHHKICDTPGLNWVQILLDIDAVCNYSPRNKIWVWQGCIKFDAILYSAVINLNVVCRLIFVRVLLEILTRTFKIYTFEDTWKTISWLELTLTFTCSPARYILRKVIIISNVRLKV